MKTQLHMPHKLLLTGTPVQNNLGELHALLSFRTPAVFKPTQRRAFVDHSHALEAARGATSGTASTTTASGGGAANRQRREQRAGAAGKTAQLHALLRPYMLRRTKLDSGMPMPPLTEAIVHCGMSEMQKRWYALLDRLV
jgi:SNF2 family DNA or RNA helicase